MNGHVQTVSWESPEAWERAIHEVAARGLRPLVGTICPSCQRLVPREPEDRLDPSRALFCHCGGRTSSLNDHLAHGLLPSSVWEDGLVVVE